MTCINIMNLRIRYKATSILVDKNKYLYIYIYLFIYGKHCSVNCTYRWVNLPRRKNDIRELSEELLMQKQ